MSDIQASEVAARLGLDASYDAWLAELAAVEPAGEGLPSFAADDVAALLRRLGCSDETVADTVATLPDPARDPARWWLLERSHHRLVAAMGDPDVSRGLWPQLPAALGPAGGCFPIHVFVATVPAVQAWHRTNGIPEDISWRTLGDLGRHEAIQRTMTGMTGVDEPWWLTLHLRGVILEIGRLQYTRYRVGIGPEHPRPWFDATTADALGDGFRPGDPSLGVHIPPGGPLDPQACERSMRAAKTLFDTRFPSATRRVATCSSWLLDDQLGEYLPADSNIIGFALPFHLVPTWWEGDTQVLGFVFVKRGQTVGRLEPRTLLERSVVAHLDSGRHFHWRTGWRDLPA